MTTDDKDLVLLPCPFCGSHDIQMRSSREWNTDPNVTERFWVECLACGAEPFQPEEDKAELINAWNTRPEAADRIEQLSSWMPIESAPKDGTPVLVSFGNLSEIEPARTDLGRWSGICAVMRNRGDSSNWSFAAPVGQGGFPDDWLVGWKSIEALSALQSLQVGGGE